MGKVFYFLPACVTIINRKFILLRRLNIFNQKAKQPEHAILQKRKRGTEMSEKEKKKTKADSAKRRGLGLTVKLTAAVIISVMIAVSALLAVVSSECPRHCCRKVRKCCTPPLRKPFRRRRHG